MAKVLILSVKYLIFVIDKIILHMSPAKVTFLAAALSAVISCGVPDDYSFQYITFKETIPYTQGEQHPSYSFDISVLHANGSDSAFSSAFNRDISGLLFGAPQDDVRDAMIKFIDLRITQFRDEIRELKEYDSENGYTTSDIDYVYSLRTDIANGNGSDIINCNILIYEYAGGAHGASFKTCRNYMTDGTLITPDDYFVNGYREKLVPVLEKELFRIAGCTERSQLDEKGFFSNTEMYVPDNFIIGKDSVTFIFNQYEIGPYSSGIVELKIANSDMPAHIIR